MECWGLVAIAVTVFAFADDGVGQAPFIPDHARTPGAVDPEVTQENVAQTVCVPGYTKTGFEADGFEMVVGLLGVLEQDIRSISAASRDPALGCMSYRLA